MASSFHGGGRLRLLCRNVPPAKFRMSNETRNLPSSIQGAAPVSARAMLVGELHSRAPQAAVGSVVAVACTVTR